MAADESNIIDFPAKGDILPVSGTIDLRITPQFSDTSEELVGLNLDFKQHIDEHESDVRRGYEVAIQNVVVGLMSVLQLEGPNDEDVVGYLGDRGAQVVAASNAASVTTVH